MRRPRPAPVVKLGRTHPDGVSPSMYGLLQRGAERHPRVAARMRGKIVMRFDEYYLPVRIEFRDGLIKVADGEIRGPDLVISGRLPDIVHFAAAPAWRGIPKVTHPRGLAAIARVARKRVSVDGDIRLARALLALLAID